MNDPSVLLEPLRRVHDEIRNAVVAAAAEQSDELASIHRDEEGDTIYAIDAVSEGRLLELFRDLPRGHSFVLIAEGLHGGKTVFPPDSTEAAAAWRIVVDPV